MPGQRENQHQQNENQFSNQIFRLGHTTYAEQVGRSTVDRKIDISKRRLLTKELENTVKIMSRRLCVDPAKIKAVIKPHILSKINRLEPQQQHDIETIRSIERDALYYATEEIAAITAKSMAIRQLSSEAFGLSTKGKKAKALEYLQTGLSEDIVIDKIYDDYFTKHAAENNDNKYIAASDILLGRDKELSNANNNTISRPMLFALEKIAANMDYPVEKIKDLYYDTYASRDPLFWSGVVERKFSKQKFTDNPYFEDQNILSYRESLVEEEVLKAMQHTLISMNIGNDQRYDRDYVDYEIGDDYLRQYQNITVDELKQRSSQTYAKLKDSFGMRNDQIEKSFRDGSTWCKEDYEDGIKATAMMKKNLNYVNNDILELNDFYNAKNFYKKSQLRIKNYCGEDNGREINVLNLASKWANARGGSYTRGFGDAVSDPIKGLGEISPVLFAVNQELGAVTGVASVIDSILSNGENSYKNERLGMYVEERNHKTC